MNSKRLIEMCNKWDRIISEISDVENGENKSNILQCCSKDKWLGGGGKNYLAPGLSISGVFSVRVSLFVFFLFLFQREIYKEKESER